MKKLEISIIIDDSIIKHHHGVRRYLFSMIRILQEIASLHLYKIIFSDEVRCHYSKIHIDDLFMVNNGFNYSSQVNHSKKEEILNISGFAGDEEEVNKDFYSYSSVYFGPCLPFSDICIVGAPWVLSSIKQDIKSGKVYCLGYDAIPMIYSFNDINDSVLYDFSRMHYVGYAKAINSYDGVLAISEASKDQILSFFPSESNKIFVVPPFVPLGFNNVKLCDKDDNSVILAAPFDIRKGLKKIPSLLNKSNVKKVKIFGGIRCSMDDVFEFFDELKCNDIEWWPNVTTQKQIELYSSSSLLIFPSYSEGLGLPIIEAMSCGTNVLVTDIEPLNKLVNSDSILTNSESHNIEKINSLMKNVDSRLNVRHAMLNWGSEVFLRELSSIFNI